MEKPSSAPTRPRGLVSRVPISELTRCTSSGSKSAASSTKIIQGSKSATQSAANLRLVKGHNSAMPVAPHKSKARCKHCAASAKKKNASSEKRLRKSAPANNGKTTANKAAHRMDAGSAWVYVPRHARYFAGSVHALSKSTSAMVPATTAAIHICLGARGHAARSSAREANPCVTTFIFISGGVHTQRNGRCLRNEQP